MRNGFLLGELLFRHNQLHSFGKFQRTNSSDAKINNFCLVESSLRAMNVKFDAQTANAIMQGKPGAASTVLYKVWAGVGGGWGVADGVSAPPSNADRDTREKGPPEPAATSPLVLMDPPGENVLGPADQLHYASVVIPED